MNTEEILEKCELKSGKHKDFEDGACVMELVSYIAGEPWTDHPKCACPILTNYAINLNDRFDNKDRQLLKPLIPKLLNSRDDSKRKVRYEFLALQAITVFLPILTDALNLKEVSYKLRLFTVNDWIAARDYINSVQSIIRTAAASAYAADAAYAASAASSASAASAAASAASAYAAASAADAYAYAYAAAAYAYASAASAYAYASAASAASASAASKSTTRGDFWIEIKKKIVNAAIEALNQATE